MATIENITRKLLELIEHDEPFAIGLIGEWGIGKTHFWKEFYNEKHKSFKLEKYSYVSLFGIDSLESLKYQIVINTRSTSEKEDPIPSLKKLLSKFIENVNFPEIAVKGFSLAITQSMIKNIVSQSIRKTVICIDDFERRSEQLSVKEVMGFINFLKEEQKCKVIMILHEEKIGKENSDFQEYKEKIFDEVLLLNDNLPLIREIIEDDEIIGIYEDFYQKLGIKNLRFYKKVHKDYKELIQLGKNLSLTSKEYILKNLLVIRMVKDLGDIELEFDNKGEKDRFKVDIDFLSCTHNPLDYSDIQLKKLESFNDYLNEFITFYHLDKWGDLIISKITEYDINKEVLDNLSKEDLISEKKIQDEINFTEIMKEFHSLRIKPDFINRFYPLAENKIYASEASETSPNNLSFYYEVIKCCSPDLAEQFKLKVENTIREIIKNSNNQLSISEFYPYWEEKDDVFFDFIQQELDEVEKNRLENLPPQEPFLQYYKAKDYDRNLDLNSITKEQLQEIVWCNIGDDYYRKKFIASIIFHPVFSEKKKDQVRQWIIEILEDEIKNNPHHKIPIRMWLDDTNNLTTLNKYWP